MNAALARIRGHVERAFGTRKCSQPPVEKLGFQQVLAVPGSGTAGGALPRGS